MKKVFFLKTCDTCRKIMKEFDLSQWELREIKTKNITEEELEELYSFTSSYEKLFSKRSSQIKQRKIDVKSLSEDDFKQLILEHYSFLKRPIFVSVNDIFVGNDRDTIEKLANFFG